MHAKGGRWAALFRGERPRCGRGADWSAARGRARIRRQQGLRMRGSPRCGESASHGGCDDHADGQPLGRAQVLAEQYQCQQRSDGGLHADHDAERLLGQAFERHHFQHDRHGAGQCGHADAGEQHARRQQASPGMPDAHGHHDQRCRGQTEGYGMPGVQVPQALAEQDVARPEHGGHQREEHTPQVQRSGTLLPGQQQAQPRDRQNHPEEIQRPAGRQQRHRQRAGELDRHGHAEGNGLQRQVETEVHRTQGGAVGGNACRIGPCERPPPGTPQERQQQGREAHPQGRGALGADQREQGVLGPGRADPQEGHGSEDGKGRYQR